MMSVKMPPKGSGIYGSTLRLSWRRTICWRIGHLSGGGRSRLHPRSLKPTRFRGTSAIRLLTQATSLPSFPKSVMQPLYSTSIHIIRNSTSGRSGSRSSMGRNYLRSIDREKSPVRRKSNGRHHTNSLACDSELPAQAVDDTQAGIHSRASGGQHAACHAPVRQLLRLAAIATQQPRPQENICATSICISEVEDLLCELVNYDEERVCLSSCTS